MTCAAAHRVCHTPKRLARPSRRPKSTAILNGHWPAQHHGATPRNVRECIEQTKADVLFEASSLDVHTGQPAIDHIKTALHWVLTRSALTRDRLHALRELTSLAREKGKSFCTKLRSWMACRFSRCSAGAAGDGVARLCGRVELDHERSTDGNRERTLVLRKELKEPRPSE